MRAKCRIVNWSYSRNYSKFTLNQPISLSFSPPLLEKRENQGGGKNSTFLRKTQKICHFFGRRRRPKTHFLTFFKVARRRRKIFMILCDVMMGNTVVIDHLGDDFRSQLTEICKIFRLRRAILKNVESPPLLENRENQGGGNSTISVDAAL